MAHIRQRRSSSACCKRRLPRTSWTAAPLPAINRGQIKPQRLRCVASPAQPVSGPRRHHRSRCARATFYNGGRRRVSPDRTLLVT